MDYPISEHFSKKTLLQFQLTLLHFEFFVSNYSTFVFSSWQLVFYVKQNRVLQNWSYHLLLNLLVPNKVVGSKEAEEAEEEAEQNLDVAFRLLIDTQGWGGVVWKVVQGVTQVGVAIGDSPRG